MFGETVKRITRSFSGNKNLGKIILAFTLTGVILGGLLLFSTPVNAISVNLVNLPSTMTVGNTYSFTSQVTINTNENVPIDSLRLDLTGPTNAFAVFNTDGTITSQSSGDQFVSIVKQGTSTYSEGSRSGYGYAYSSGSTTLAVAVSAPLDETELWYDGSNSSWVWDAGDIDTSAGYWNSSMQKWGSGIRFANVNIPKGATITSAYLTFTARYTESGTGCNTVISGDKESDAAAFIGSGYLGLTDYQSRRGTDVGGANNNLRTTAKVNWGNIEDMTQGDQFNSPDISSVIQEIVDQSNWNSGNHLALFWDDNAGNSNPIDYTWRGAYSYLGSINSFGTAIASPVLHIVYGSAGTGSYQTSWGYGYGYSGPTTLQYLVTIRTSAMQVGNYNAQMSVNVPQPVDSSVTKFLSNNYSFTIQTASGGGGGGGVQTSTTTTTTSTTTPVTTTSTTPITTTSTTTPITTSTSTVTTVTTTKTTTTPTTSTTVTTTQPPSTTTITPSSTTSTVSTTKASKALLPLWSWVVIVAGVIVIALVILMVRRNR